MYLITVIFVFFIYIKIYLFKIIQDFKALKISKCKLLNNTNFHTNIFIKYLNVNGNVVSMFIVHVYNYIPILQTAT